MARKKTAVDGGVAAPVAVSNTNTDTELRRKFGDDCLYTGDRILESPPEVLSASPRLDVGLGGGIQVGTIVTLAGPSGCGKTSTALHLASKWQVLGRQVYYVGAESRLWAINFRGVAIDPARVKVLGSAEGQILSAQDYLTAVELILRDEREAMIIIDSISILSEENELNAKTAGEGQVGGANRLVGSFLRRMAPILPLHRHVVVAIAQVYTNIGGKKKYKVNMPLKLEFARGTGLVCDWAEPLMSGKEQVGQTIHWKVERSSLGPPGAKVDSILRYGVGVDEVGELADMGVEYALIKASGSWYHLAFLGDDPPKVQGMEKVREYLVENSAAKATLEERLRYYTRP